MKKIKCRTWKDVEEVKKKYLKPVRFGPKGQPIYSLEELLKIAILPENKQTQE